MTELNERLLDSALKIILKAAAYPDSKAIITGLVRQHVVDFASAATPRLRQQLITDHEIALEYWLTEYIGEPSATFTFADDGK